MHDLIAFVHVFNSLFNEFASKAEVNSKGNNITYPFI